MKNSLKHILSIFTCVTLTAALAFPVQAAEVSSIRMGSYKGNTLAVGERSGLADSGENMLTLYTCVRNQRDQRWCVTAAEV